LSAEAPQLTLDDLGKTRVVETAATWGAREQDPGEPSRPLPWTRGAPLGNLVNNLCAWTSAVGLWQQHRVCGATLSDKGSVVERGRERQLLTSSLLLLLQHCRPSSPQADFDLITNWDQSRHSHRTADSCLATPGVPRCRDCVDNGTCSSLPRRVGRLWLPSSTLGPS